MDYKQTIEYLFSRLPMFSRVGAAAYKPGLERVSELDAAMGHPHRSFRSVHVAGTNGKGSCSHLLAAILQSAGYKTGLYTSPHLVDFRERMRVNGRMIPEDKVIEFAERFRHDGEPQDPSFFELTMMLAFSWFAEEKVDVAVIETGMGGRLDSTNIITPVGCVITNISKDHTQFLGETEVEIAGEKAGIIKPSVPVVVGESKDDVRKVFTDKASREKAPVSFADDSADVEFVSHTSEGWRIRPGDDGETLCPLPGEYQKANIRTVYAAVKMLRGQGFDITSDAVRDGFANVKKLTGLRGRWDILRDDPLVIADTGHNVAGLSYNLSALGELQRQRNGRLLMVLGFVADKDIDHIIDMMPRDAEYFLTNAHIPRALPADKLAERFAASGRNGRVFPDVHDAYAAALAEASPADIIYVGGSTFIVADFYQ